jgi:membrane protein
MDMTEPTSGRLAWRLGGVPLGSLARRVQTQVWAHDLLDRAAALSYYFLFALFPTLLFLTTLVGLLPIPYLMDQLVGYFIRVLPADAASLLVKTLGEIRSGANSGLLSLGVIAALWGASGGMLSIISALNAAYDVVDRRPWWKRRIVALALTCGFSLFTLTAVLLLVFGERIGEAAAALMGMGPLFTRTWNVLQWPAIMVCGLAGIDLVYYLAPAVRLRWTWVTPGSGFAVVAWLGMSFVLRLYVRFIGDYNATYGSIGGVILLMLWLYWTSLALLVGAEINAELEVMGLRRPPAAETASRRRTAPAAPAERLLDR